MKLRIKGNSIRLRLLRSEVDRFEVAGQISETIEFGGSSFLRYALVMSPEATEVSARFRGNELAIVVPRTLAREWASGNDVGFDGEQSVGSGETLTILVEKDFVCLDRPNDPDRADAFPNPNLTCDPEE
jgi:hypothetical protein